MDNKMILTILKWRKKIFDSYITHNKAARILVKGIGALCLFLSVNMFYHNTQSVMMVGAAILSLFCAVIPSRYIYGLTALFTGFHLFQISWDLALCYGVIVFFSWVLVCRIRPETGVIIAFTPFLFFFKMPFLMPLLVGMFYSLFGVAAMAFGLLLYFFGLYSINAAAALSSATTGKDMLGIQAVLTSFAGDKEIVLLLAALVIGAVVTYIIYHLPKDHSWYIGCVAGGIAGLVVYLGGGIILGFEKADTAYILTVPIAMCICCATQFMRCIIDYSGVEWVEFEDDDYYYYVKAVPKVNVIVEDFALIDAAKEAAKEQDAAKTEELRESEAQKETDGNTLDEKTGMEEE